MYRAKFMSMRSWMSAAALCACAIAAAATAEPAKEQKSRYQPRTERGIEVARFVRRWAGHVHGAYGTPPMAWARSMERTFAEVDVRDLKRANAVVTYTGAMNALVGRPSSSSRGTLRPLRSNATAVSSVAETGAAPLVYVAVSPCRILDTRNAGGRLSSGEARPIFVHGSSFASQGGAAESCSIPVDPAAVVVNVVAVGPSDNGFLSVYPYGSVRAASSLNYGAGAIVANELIAKTTVGQPFGITLYSQASTDVVVDVTGYFVAATPPPAFKAVSREYTRSFELAPGATAGVTSLCQPGETVLSGSPSGIPENVTLVYSGLVYEGSNNGWTVEYKNHGTDTAHVYASTSALCTPGTLTAG